jgi:hypothetical protein
LLASIHGCRLYGSGGLDLSLCCCRLGSHEHGPSRGNRIIRTRCAREARERGSKCCRVCHFHGGCRGRLHRCLYSCGRYTGSLNATLDFQLEDMLLSKLQCCEKGAVLTFPFGQHPKPQQNLSLPHLNPSLCAPRQQCSVRGLTQVP